LKGIDASSGCVSIFDTVIVSLDGGPLGVTLSVQDDTICSGESTVLTAYGFGGNYNQYTYTWYEGSNPLSEPTPVFSMTVSPTTPGNHNYSVVIDDGYNTFNASITVTVATTPVFSISSTDQIIACPADTVTLQPDNTYPGATYYWSNGSTEQSVHIATTGIGYSIKTVRLNVTNSEGCQYADSVTVIFDFAACFGVNEYSSFPEIRIYPNPTTGLINIDLEDGEGFSELQILNPQGSVIYQKDLGNLMPGNNKIVADLSEFPKGVYFLRAIHERFIHQQKVVLN
jgi:hypothetical protein